MGGEGAESGYLFLGDMPFGRIVRPPAGQVEAQCAAFEPLLPPVVGRLSSIGPEAAGFVTGSYMQPDQLRLAAEACMGVGYRRDTMDLAGDWLQAALGALEASAGPVFHMPGVPDRAALLEWAVFDRRQASVLTGAEATITTFGIAN